MPGLVPVEIDLQKPVEIIRSAGWVKPLVALSGAEDRVSTGEKDRAGDESRGDPMPLGLRAQLIQLQDEHTPYSLEDSEEALNEALKLDNTYFYVIVELMHFYDAVCPDTPKAIEYAKQVKVFAQQVLSEAHTILEEETETHDISS